VPVVDAHTHLLPGRLAEKVRAFLDAHLAGTIVYPLDHGLVRDRLAADGVDELWSLPYAHKPGVAEGLNESMAATAARSGAVRVVGGATVHPGDPDPMAVLRRAVEDLGLRVLKLHCSVGDYRPDDVRLTSTWAYVNELRLPVVVHAGHAVSGHTHADELAPIATVAERYPDAPIIIAHCGHRAVEAALDLVEQHQNVYADLTPVVAEPVVVPVDRLDAVGPKLLFGSDAPNTGIVVGDAMDAVRRMPLAESTRAAILGGTASALQRGVRT
jgi:predicted TIM-barrel fold metal-dependent hydrolase